MTYKPVIYLLDASGSMSIGSRLPSLNETMKALCNRIKDTPTNPEVRLEISAYTFNDMDNEEVLTEIFASADPENAADSWSDIPSDNIIGGTPLGKALIAVSKILRDNNKKNEMIGEKSAAPAIIILSDGEPTDYDENGNPRLQPMEALLADLDEAKRISADFARSLRATVALEVDKGSEAEKKLFALAHGSRSFPTEKLRIHSSDNPEDLIQAVWSATQGTMGEQPGMQ